ncbi:hypothetical protein ACIQM0_11615 [Streptomyces sp. NPDC091387]|uniref:hypothetical protein n=1 Tax=Streptomyces sp. NPDC091387 TaxID=3365998 RepID=UPI0037F60BDA
MDVEAGVFAQPGFDLDDIDDLGDELRVGGQFEGVLQVRLEVELLPDPADGRRTNSARSSPDNVIFTAEGPGCDMTTGC